MAFFISGEEMPIPINALFDEGYTQFDYDVRTDDNAVYIGYATSPNVGDSETRWTVKKLTYDGSNRCTKIQIAYKIAWSDRTTAGHWA